jgi:hypothetical protein
MRSTLLLLGSAALLCAACAASASAKVNTGGDANANAEASGETSGTATPGPSAPQAPPPPTQTNATAFSAGPQSPGTYGVCPFRCYVAEGAKRVAMAPEDEARLGQAFAEPMGQFRACGEGRRYRHRRSSPIVNLRFNAQGELAEEGYDLEAYVGDPEINCYATVPRTMPTVAGPPSSTVRCAEICERPKPPPKAPKAPKEPKGARAPKKAEPAAAPDKPAN